MFIQKRVSECLQQFNSPLPQTGTAQCEWINWGTPTQQNTTQQQKGTRLLFHATIWMHLKCIFLCENSRSGNGRPGARDKRVQRRVWPPRRNTGKLRMRGAWGVHVELSNLHDASHAEGILTQAKFWRTNQVAGRTRNGIPTGTK